MYNVTQAFKDAIKQNGRQFKSSVTIRNTTFDDNSIIEIGLEENTNPTESFILGGVGSSKLDITLTNVPDTLILEDANITATISLLVNGVYEDVPLGTFTVDEISKDKNVVKLTCYDNMIKLEKAYFSDLSYPISINSVAQEICTKAGVQLATVLPNIQINKIDGYTFREAIGFIASFLGGFARFNRAGKLEILSYVDSGFSVTSDIYSKLSTSEQLFTIGKLTCKVGDSILTAGANGNEIQFENPIMIQAQLDSIYNTLRNLSYMPYSMNWHGNQALQAGDKITITDLKGNTYNTLLMDNKISYKGGLSGTASAVGKTETGQNFNSSGSIKNSVDRMVIDQANIKLVLAEKVSTIELEANYAHMVNGVIDNASIDVAHVTNLYGNYAHIVNGVIENASIDVANINNLSATYATIVNLTAATGRITLIESDTANIKTILAGNVGAANLQVGAIQAGSAVIANEAIGSSQIISLAVGKLLAGDISTTKFRIVSDSGNMLMSDNTIQIKDPNRVRIQIGKDASNDYSMYVWDADGNLMFDALGLKASGIKDKIIRNDMVSDTANIDAKKLDINSLFVQINGASQTIKSTKIFLDKQAQTLDLAFNTLNNTVTSQGQTITSQGTSITAIQGNITNKIWSTDITTAINGIQVGARNLIVYNKLLAYNGTINADYKTGIVTGNGTYYIRLNNANLKPSTQYTFSNSLIDNPTSNTVGKVQIVIYDSAMTAIKQTVGYLLNNNILTFTTVSTILPTDVLLIYPTTTQSTTYTIKNLQLEVGNKISDWRASQEDVQGQIDAVNTNITTNYSTTTQTNQLISTQVGAVTTDLHNNYSTISATTAAINTVKDSIALTVSNTVARNACVNLVDNGGFETDLTGWCADYGTISLDTTNYVSSPNSMKITTSLNGAYYYGVANVSTVKQDNPDHKYYFSCMFKNGTATRIYLSSDHILSSWNTDKTKFTKASGITQFWGDGLDLLVQVDGTAAGQYAYVDDILIVDLTETFGAGNEPDITWCDANLTYGQLVTNSQSPVSSRLSAVESSLKVQAGEITSKVSSNDFNGNNIVSLINQSASKINMSALNIDLSGYVTISSLGASGTTVIDGSRIITGAINASLITTGYLSADRISGGTINGITIKGSTITALNTLTIGAASEPTLSLHTNGATNNTKLSASCSNVGNVGSECDNVSLAINSSASAHGSLEIYGWPYTEADVYINGRLILYEGTATISASGGYSYLGKKSAFSWGGTIASGTSVTITHNLGYKPIVSIGGTLGNVIITYQYVDNNSIKVNAYANAWTGSVYLW
ncbi:hypothetical protein [Candidatus Clostridium stratigraminis]|uniref:Uncharacterized protein n=1 Tax=Candidatus Clostridium stratigraminis TaxID=3381661 RepID=A0ABW8T362_9CLOT